MQDIILGSLVYISPFLKVVFVGVFLWLILRGFYKKQLYSGKLWHPNIIDISIMVIVIYIVHLVGGFL